MSKSAELAQLIRDRAGSDAPEYGLILGSGLGHLSAQIDGVAIPYDDLPGFPHAGVSGHVPQLVIGTLEGRRVAVFGGRSHYYESGRADAMRLPLEVLAALGTDKLILTNAAGSLRPDIARRILSASLRWITGAGYAPRGPELERLLAALAGGKGGTLAGCRVTLAKGAIRLARELAAVRDMAAAPGAIWDGRWRLTAPETPGASIRAPGPKGRAACPDWRGSGLPAHSVEATPAVWQGATLIAAPLAGRPEGWSARLTRGANDLQAMLLSH